LGEATVARGRGESTPRLLLEWRGLQQTSLGCRERPLPPPWISTEEGLPVMELLPVAVLPFFSDLVLPLVPSMQSHTRWWWGGGVVAR
jgi:hypothetical protein